MIKMKPQNSVVYDPIIQKTIPTAGVINFNTGTAPVNFLYLSFITIICWFPRLVF